MSTTPADAQVFIGESTEAVGGVREIHHDHLIVWIENWGDVRLDGKHVAAVHDGKVILDPSGLDAQLLEHIGQAHDRENGVPPPE